MKWWQIAGAWAGIALILIGIWILAKGKERGE
jgi:LPXTG-motif cell wall-anchored protein